ncbi:uncharacterized protein LOC127854061 isoform X2 [Dreissena polymorpha]|uniref:uncharacterized protein LOC127854061 isoform X2 n=1 Tax=Dreissena polymorpha TaxID=45954 RepID=UPI002263C9AC|nr:uncharacterized protein LOC127854061 isoform X2 [Dreissena polymorpha]
MLCIILVLLDILSSVNGKRSSAYGKQSMTISNKLQRFNISCTDGLIMLTRIYRLREVGSGPHENSSMCLNQQYDVCINNSDDQVDRYRKFILARCSFYPSCSLMPIGLYTFNIRITYICVPEQRVIDICGGLSTGLNIGDQRHLVLLNTAPSGACVCTINGSAEVVLRDFFTIKNLSNAPYDQSDSKLWLGKALFDSRYNSSIVHGDFSFMNVFGIIFSFNNIIQRLWLRVTAKDNGTYIRCADLTTNMTTNSMSTGITTAITSYPTHTKTTVNEHNPAMNAVTIQQDLQRTKYPPMSPVTSSEPFSSNSRNTTTLGTPNTSTSLIKYVASGSVVVVVVVVVFGCILIVKHRRQNYQRRTNLFENKPKSERRLTLTISSFRNENFAKDGRVDNDYDCQTVDHVPRITRGRVEYAVSMPPEIYHYSKPDSKSMSSKQYANSLDNTHANDEDGICNSHLRLRPIFRESTDFCTGINDTERAIRVALDDAYETLERDTLSTVHVYNHMMFGRKQTEVNNDSGVLCSDEYSHISANDVVNIQADRSRGQPSDAYCYIGLINGNDRKHLSSDDYDHLVM